MSTDRACILATRCAIEVLGAFGVDAAPWPCAVWVGNDLACQMLTAGVPLSRWPAEAHSVGVAPEAFGDGHTGGYAGHLVAATGRLLVDLSAGQYDRPERGIHMGPLVVAVPDGDDRVLKVGDGTWAVYRHRPELVSWRNAPDWRRPAPAELTHKLVGAVGKILGTTPAS